MHLSLRKDIAVGPPDPRTPGPSNVRTETSSAPIDRRRFLGVVGSLAAATATTACGSSISESAEIARPELVAALGAVRVRELGARYRELTPSERDAESLRGAIARSMPWSARLPWSEAASTADLVHQDFAAGRTVTVLGWILSTTEARQCALFSLLPA